MRSQRRPFIEQFRDSCAGESNHGSAPPRRPAIDVADHPIAAGRLFAALGLNVVREMRGGQKE